MRSIGEELIRVMGRTAEGERRVLVVKGEAAREYYNRWRVMAAERAERIAALEGEVAEVMGRCQDERRLREMAEAAAERMEIELAGIGECIQECFPELRQVESEFYGGVPGDSGAVAGELIRSKDDLQTMVAADPRPLTTREQAVHLIRELKKVVDRFGVKGTIDRIARGDKFDAPPAPGGEK